MKFEPPPGYLGSDARITSGPAPELVAAGYALEIADAPLLHEGLGLADLAHVLSLTEDEILPDSAARPLLLELLNMLETDPKDFPYDAVYGDAYNSRERELTTRIGTDAGWLHTGRTRREAGRIAFRIALRHRLLDLHDAIGQLAAAFAAGARAHAETVWADTTYLQPAQPSTFGHYLGSFAEESGRHLGRVQAAFEWANCSPAGAGGVGGSPLVRDRDREARALGFREPGRQTRDAMWATDGLVDAVSAATQAVVTVSRFAEDLEIFSSPPFGYVRLDASLCRASVLMPQKRNPYALAVIRSGAGVLIGRLTGLLATQRTPSARTDNWLHAYGEVASSLELATRLIRLAAVVVSSLEVDTPAMAAAAGAHFTGAADLAETFVAQQGVDYRTGYRVVGKAIAIASERGDLSLRSEHLQEAAASLGAEIDTTIDVAAITDPTTIVYSRDVLGGSAPDRVREHADHVELIAKSAHEWRVSERAAVNFAELSVVRRAHVTLGNLSNDGA